MENSASLFTMRTVAIILSCWSVAFDVTTHAQTTRRSLLDADPKVVVLDEILKKPIRVTVVEHAPVFSDYLGRNRLGTLRANQEVTIEAITDQVYRVRGRGMRDGIAGWVPPWAFRSEQPEFVELLKTLYDREIIVRQLIEERRIAIGMTFDEVRRCKGEPTKATVRRDGDGQSGKWEYIEYHEVKHFTNHIDPVSGQVFRTLSHVTREESGKTAVEFTNGLASAIEESKEDRPPTTRIVVPPFLFYR